MTNATHPRVRGWMEVREPLERQLAPLGSLGMAALGPISGHRVLDVGCGVGGTSRALAEAAGPSGAVVGLDLLADASAVQRHTPDNPLNLHFVCGDAAAAPLTPESFDAVYSRFGLAFFETPRAGFRALRGLLRPGGRLAFVAWRDISENELDYLPLLAAAPHLPPRLTAAAAAGPGFSLAAERTISKVLSEAGFLAIEIAAHDLAVTCGDLPSTLAVCRRVGALGSILREHPQFADAALAAVGDTLAKRNGPDGPHLTAAVWVVSARAPA